MLRLVVGSASCRPVLSKEKETGQHIVETCLGGPSGDKSVSAGRLYFFLEIALAPGTLPGGLGIPVLRRSAFFHPFNKALYAFPFVETGQLAPSWK